MKNLSGISVVLAIVVLSACEGHGGAVGALPYTLSVDKTMIESDGKDAATLVITDADGVVLSTEANMRKASFHIEETGEWRSGMGTKDPNVFTSIDDGEYTITAIYDGVQCENTVVITSQNRRNYELFHKNVAIYRLTGTWCQYCPYMTEALKNVNEYTKDHSNVMEFHNADEYSVGYSMSMDMAAFLLRAYGTSGAGYPYCIYSISEGSEKRTVKDIQTMVRKQLEANPARTGIKASSSVVDGRLVINAEVTASAAGRYDLGMAILRDHCIPTSSSAFEDEYNDVVTTISGNFHGMSSDSFELAAAESKCLIRDCDVSSLDIANCRVVLFIVTEVDGKAIIDNAVDFMVGERVDYRYN